MILFAVLVAAFAVSYLVLRHWSVPDFIDTHLGCQVG
jgi:hypothetical protein